MKRANLLIRKADRDGLADLGFSDETISKKIRSLTCAVQMEV
jgi:hypothetical protein